MPAVACGGSCGGGRFGGCGRPRRNSSSALSASAPRARAVAISTLVGMVVWWMDWFGLIDRLN
jgi:hypothetical protein